MNHEAIPPPCFQNQGPGFWQSPGLVTICFTSHPSFDPTLGGEDSLKFVDNSGQKFDLQPTLPSILIPWMESQQARLDLGKNLIQAPDIVVGSMKRVVWGTENLEHGFS